jgi:soluble lytic murein transglycosylase-like protein
MRKPRAIRPVLRAVLATAVLLAPVLAGAAVEVRAGSAGRHVVTNENESQRARRLAPYLVVPAEDDLLTLIERHAADRGLDPRLVRAVVQVESGYNPAALSNKGAMGLMQLMPATARDLAVERPFEPEANLRGGTEYLRALIERFGGRMELALAAYNAGPSAVERYGGVPPYAETLGYVHKVLSLWRGEALPAIVPARAFPLAPARPVVWRAGGQRAHLTNLQN